MILVKYMEKQTPNQKATKANAHLCPFCCVEYVEVEFDFEVDGVVLHNVKALRCPSCQEEAFSPEQMEEIMKKISV
jgi:hypothetical protein